MIYEIKLKIKDYATLTIYTDYETIKDKLTEPKSSIMKTIPITSTYCTKIERENICYSNAIIISKNDNKNMYYDKTYNVSLINANEDEIRFYDIIYICLAMFSKILAGDEKYLIHSSSLADPLYNGIVLVGEANAGKTSLAYELVSKHNYKLISNDHSVIGIENGKPMILGGTKEIQMRLGAIELYFPDLYKKIDIETDDKWNKKLIVNSLIEPELILNEKNDKVLLSNIFNINTTNCGEPFIMKKDRVDEFLFLYESMSKIIKGTYNYITGFNYPMPSMEEGQILFNLSELCKNIIENCDVFEAKGSVSGLAKILAKKYEK